MFGIVYGPFMHTRYLSQHLVTTFALQAFLSHVAVVNDLVFGGALDATQCRLTA